MSLLAAELSFVPLVPAFELTLLLEESVVGVFDLFGVVFAATVFGFGCPVTGVFVGPCSGPRKRLMNMMPKMPTKAIAATTSATRVDRLLSPKTSPQPDRPR